MSADAALFVSAMARPFRTAASFPCPSHAPAPRIELSRHRSGTRLGRAPSGCAARCRSPDAIRRGCGTPNRASISGYIRSRAPQSRSTVKNALAAGSRSAFSVSCQTRSATSASTSCRSTMLLHQGQRIGGDAKAERRKARREARHAQYAHRVLDESSRDVPQASAPRCRACRHTDRSARRRRSAPSH